MKAEYVKPNVHFEMFAANTPVAKGGGSMPGVGGGSSSGDTIVSGCGVNSTVFFDCFQGSSVDQTLVLSTYFNIANGTGTTTKICDVQAGFADYSNTTNAGDDIVVGTDADGNSIYDDPDDITSSIVNLGNNLSSQHTTNNVYIDWSDSNTNDTADVEGPQSVLSQFLGWFYISYSGNSATQSSVDNSYWSISGGKLTYSGSTDKIQHAALAPVFSLTAITSL